MSDKAKPKYRKLTIEKIERNMKGGAKLSFKGDNPDIVVDTQKYRVGDTYRVPVKPKTTKKK